MNFLSYRNMHLSWCISVHFSQCLIDCDFPSMKIVTIYPYIYRIIYHRWVTANSSIWAVHKTLHHRPSATMKIQFFKKKWLVNFRQVIWWPDIHLSKDHSFISTLFPSMIHKCTQCPSIKSVRVHKSLLID